MHEQHFCGEISAQLRAMLVWTLEGLYSPHGIH